MPNEMRKTKLSMEMTERQRREVLAKWNGLRDTHRDIFEVVFVAWRNRQTHLPDDIQLPDWVSHQDIAAEYGKDRLIDSRVKLLGDLVAKGFLERRKRSNGHWVNGRWMPYNFSWVYRPDLTHAVVVFGKPEKPQVKRVQLPNVPERPTSQNPPPGPFISKNAPGEEVRVKVVRFKKPQSAVKRFWNWLAQID